MGRARRRGGLLQDMPSPGLGLEELQNALGLLVGLSQHGSGRLGDDLILG